MTGGIISPRAFGGKKKFLAKPYLEQLTHGMPSGFSQEEMKLVKAKVAGGTMANVLN